MLGLLLVPLLGSAAVDPTRPPAAETPTVNRPQVTLQLQSVMIRGQDRTAVIGGRLYREGEQVAGARIIRIEQWRVVLETGAGPRVLEMAGQTVVKKGSSK
ncbi:hypothetical protein D0544_14840 [Aestuariirhabdus litorea]|uniref:MSHA biogenesis protein MshK n=1 Tax=Aestuariirhabdus litorea TaxID=2528527 RepID=A0A3P3VQL4_9GAMM|nr:hypothetical protein D0544_14840 [Aestuariirhabdus litorea]